MRRILAWVMVATALCAADSARRVVNKTIGREVSVARHLQDDEEFRIPLADLQAHGKALFTANCVFRRCRSPIPI